MNQIKTWEQRMPLRLPESMIDCAMMQVRCMADEILELRQAIEQAERAEPVAKRDLLYATVEMQEREAKRIENIVAGLEAIKQEQLSWVALEKAADEIVRGKSVWKRFIDGTPLANDIPVWMADFAQKYTRPPTAPAQQPLTDEQIYEMYSEPCSDAEMIAFARAIEAAHGIKAKS